MDGHEVRGGLVARVHLPVRSTRSVASPPEPVTLLQPRPDVQRVTNEYVETPLRPIFDYSEKDRSGSIRTTRPGTPSRLKNSRIGVVSKQPYKGEGVSAGPSSNVTTTDQCSIICRECGRCRCDACRQPRPLPSLWLCHNLCLCSTQSCVDYASCLCCVKGLAYHCSSKDGDDDSLADDPCSCSPEHRLGRWTCLTLTSLALPCLCCYWPLRGVAAATECCYARCTARGCRCHSRPAFTPEKRLLDSSTDT